MNGPHVERVGQDESEAGGLAGIGQPIPAEHALAAHGETVLVGLDELEEVSEVVVLDVGVDQLFALAIHEADVHLAGMQIDSAVEFGGGGIIFHSCIQCWGVLRTPLNTVGNAGSARNTPRPLLLMISKNQKGFPESITALEPTRITAWLYALDTMIEGASGAQTCSGDVEGTDDAPGGFDSGGDITLRRM